MIVLEHGRHRVVRIDPEHVDQVLHLVRPFLERAVARTSGFQTADDLVATLRQGMRPWVLWAVLDGDDAVGAFVVSIERVGLDLVAQFEVLAGVEAQAWVAPLLGHFERYLAGMYGVSAMRIVGRKGWERFMARHGYRPSHFITEKRLLPACLPDQVGFLPQSEVII